MSGETETQPQSNTLTSILIEEMAVGVPTVQFSVPPSHLAPTLIYKTTDVYDILFGFIYVKHYLFKPY